ncbi:MAG TPA: NAD(P)/FAD-dependent oxidoreductase [Acetobacteraceae bacterium]|nr:NAD(P)/FAD-dependent oxidoreductase [Acetobacteraceae bacterium]
MSVVDRLAPLVDLLVRVWLAQLFWSGGSAGLEDQSPSLAMHPVPMVVLLSFVRFVLPLLLVLGLATRVAALPLLVLSLSAWRAHPGLDAPLLWALLTGWYVTTGAGAISLDRVIARGIYDTALPLAPAAGRFLAALTRAARPVALLLLRCGIAFVLVRHGMVGNGTGLLLPALLAAGVATRLAALPLLAATGAAMMHDISNEHLCWVLLLLLIFSAGPGRLSLDALLRDLLRRRLAALGMMGSGWDAALPHVVIVGGGFAGVAAAKALRHAPCAVTLIDRHNYHLFQPLLYQVATASLSPADIATPIRALFRGQANVRVMLGRVEAADPAARSVRLDDGSSVAYDTLVLATGARHAYFGHDDWEPVAPGLKTLDDATAIRRRILLAFERAETDTDAGARQALLTFAIVGGGPTGVELAGAIAELARHGLADEFRSVDPAQARVLLIQSGDRVLPSFPPALSDAARRALEALGVEVRLGPAVESVGTGGLTVAGEEIACATVFWAAGVAASPAAGWLALPADRAGRLIVQPDLTAPGHPDIFAVGDTAAIDAWYGRPVPGLAPAAKQAGEYAGRVIRARLGGRAVPPPFRYRHAGSLATIGRRQAVAEFGRIRITGPFAWWLWGAVHILFLAGARNRLVVAVEWFWAYLTFGRGTRLITGATDRAGPAGAQKYGIR